MSYWFSAGFRSAVLLADLTFVFMIVNVCCGVVVFFFCVYDSFVVAFWAARIAAMVTLE